jgi:hypothetical protein
MDTRAFSMARSLRYSASVGALVLLATSVPAISQNLGEDQITIPFSSLSVSAQREIISLQRSADRTSAPDPLLFPLDAPVSRSVTSPLQAETVMLDGRKVRVNWAIGVYR